LPDEILFEVQSPLGYSVRLQRLTWEDHSTRRPEIATHLDNVALCITQPHVVVEGEGGRVHFYRWGHGEGRTANCYLHVLVRDKGSEHVVATISVYANAPERSDSMVREALDESEKNTHELIRKLQDRGESLSEMIHERGMEVQYSAEDDYLRITLGSPRPSISLPVENGVYLLVDSDTGELNAIEVPFFVETYHAGALKSEFWRLAFEWISVGNTTSYIPAKWEQKADEAFRALVGV